MNEKLQRIYSWLSLFVLCCILFCMFCTRTDRAGSDSVTDRIYEAEEHLDQAEHKQREAIERIESAEGTVSRIEGIANDNTNLIAECQESIRRCERILEEARSRGKEVKR